MKAGNRKRLLLAGLACMGALAAFASDRFQRSRAGEKLESYTYDARFRLRGPRSATPREDIILITIDAVSFERIRRPFLLWQGQLAGVLEAVLSAGPAGVGVDLVLPDVSELDPGGQGALAGAVFHYQASGVPLRFAYRIDREITSSVSPVLLMSAGEEGFAFANLTTDRDDFVRRQELHALSDPEGASAGFALSLCRAVRSSASTIPPDRTILINFIGPDAFRKVRFSDVLEEQGDTGRLDSWFAGKIVLIGVEDETDLHPTPLYGWLPESGSRFRRTPGVVIHAHTLATLLDHSWLKPIGEAGERAILLILSILMVLICRYSSTPLAAFLATATLACYSLVACTWAFEAGFVLPVTSPALASALSFGGCQSALYFIVGRERRRLHRLFQRYVDAQVLQKLLDGTEEVNPRGERREVTVLFCDLRNFTTRSEDTPPEEVVSLLNRYFSLMVETVHSNSGMVDKFIGDCVMAIFGAPASRPDHAQLAVTAAKQMVQAVESLNNMLAEEDISPLQVSIGVHSGIAVIGNIGSPARLDYTAIGDTVNTAARLEGLNRKHGTTILVSSSTFHLVEKEHPGRFLGEETLKGKNRGVEVWALELTDHTDPG